MSDQHFPCPNCGADMRFDPASGRMVCEHCGHVDEVEVPAPHHAAIRELDFRAAIDQLLPAQELEDNKTLKCPNCGAETVVGEDVQAAECPFCATPIVTGTGTHRQIKPRGLLPFALTEEQAREAMGNWLGKLWFAPNGLQQYARKGRRMDGVYTPFWTFDADTKSSYTGQRGTDYYETKTVMRDGKREQVRVRKTRWRHVAGRVARFFDDVLVPASTSLPRAQSEALEPWDLTALEPYRPDFLAGFRAEAYTVELTEGFDAARVRMDRQIERDVKFDIGGDRQRVDHIDTSISDVTFKHILLPIWLAAYKYRGKTYRIVVNGRTGRITGERPWSPWKIAFAVIVGLIVAGIVGYIANQNQ